MQPRLLREPIRLAGLPLLRLQSDERLLRLARDGHPPAFSAIVDRYRPGLVRYCTGLVGAQRAEDAVQQTFVNAHRALTEHDELAVDLRPWLYRIAHNAALNTLRGDTEGWSLDDPAAAGEALVRSGDDVAVTVERREHLQHTLQVISGLPAAQRDALLLRELEGRSHAEIAGALGVTAGAARQHLMRARAAVRAAAAAITPYPLVDRAARWMTFTPSGDRVSQAAAGAGLGAGLVKVSAGVLATGALVGGAAVGTGVAPSPFRGHHAAAAAARPAARPSVAAAPVVTPGTTGRTVVAGTTASAARHPRHVATVRPPARARHVAAAPHRGAGTDRRAGSGREDDITTSSGDREDTHHEDGVRSPRPAARTSGDDGEARSSAESDGASREGTDSGSSSGSTETTTSEASGSSTWGGESSSSESRDTPDGGETSGSGSVSGTTTFSAPTISTGEDPTSAGDGDSDPLG